MTSEPAMDANLRQQTGIDDLRVIYAAILEHEIEHEDLCCDWVLRPRDHNGRKENREQLNKLKCGGRADDYWHGDE